MIKNKQRYRYLLLDGDDTLMDFSASEKLALFQTMGAMNIPITDSHRRYQEIIQVVWTQFEKGLLDSEAFSVYVLRCLRSICVVIFWKDHY